MTPMMQQWSQLKAQAGDSLLFFRLGDFYELFNEDAEKAAPIMGVTLTSRNSKTESQPLCGVPIANFEIYLQKLLNSGLSVALAEQTEEASAGKKLVKREIVRYFTPGIRFLESDDASHYCALVAGKPNQWVLAAADVATGELVLESGQDADVLQELIDHLPVEDLRITDSKFDELKAGFKRDARLLSESEASKAVLKSLQLLDNADSPAETKLQTQCLGSLLDLLQELQPCESLDFQRPQKNKDSLWLNTSTSKNLNLFEPIQDSIFESMNFTKTAMGKRFFRHLLSHPTKNSEEINQRQKTIAFLKKESQIRKSLRQQMSKIQDIHRLLRRRSSPEQIYQLFLSLKSGIEISTHFQESLFSKAPPVFDEFKDKSRSLEGFITKLEQSLQDGRQNEHDWIKSGVNSELDELRKLRKESSALLADLETKLRKQFDISNLKIKFHQVFGYVAEVGNTHKNKLSKELNIVQNLANSTRFKTEELKSLEEKLLSLDSRLNKAQEAELQKLYQSQNDFQKTILEWVEVTSKLDCFQSMAECSHQYSWTTPQLSRHRNLKLSSAFHPLTQDHFVPVSLDLSQENCRCMLLSGPNMAGKSTVMRLAALCAILHQVGSDVPAKEALLPVFDRIMCRMGAQDNLIDGKSTFFVEMKEVSSMLTGATRDSLLLFDELGRGTSTYDGMSLAWAITESIHELGCLSIVATHYLELSQLEKSLSQLKNFHVGVKEVDGRLIFTRKLEKGPASQSYGIQVARLADLDAKILQRAEKKLADFEKKRTKPKPLFELVQNHAS